MCSMGMKGEERSENVVDRTNAACNIVNIVPALIFIIVSRLHAFFLVVGPAHSSTHSWCLW